MNFKYPYITEHLAKHIVTRHLNYACPFTNCKFTTRTESIMEQHVCSHKMTELDFMDEEDLQEISETDDSYQEMKEEALDD